MSASPIYTRDEIRSFLPAGWSVAPEGRGVHDRRTGAWRLTVSNPAKLEWQLEVPAEDAERLGRLEALKQAMRRLHRLALR